MEIHHQLLQSGGLSMITMHGILDITNQIIPEKNLQVMRLPPLYLFKQEI